MVIKVGKRRLPDFSPEVSGAERRFQNAERDIQSRNFGIENI